MQSAICTYLRPPPMGLIDKIFTFKGNRQFSEAEDELIDFLNETENFIADEAYINFTHTELFAIDKESKQFLLIKKSTDGFSRDFMLFDAIESYSTSIKDRANEEWMENFSRWKKDKKFVRSISINIHSNIQNDLLLEFFISENKDGSRTSSIPIKRALFSLDIWDKVLFDIMESRKENE